MRIGLIAPPWLPVPPQAYGGTEAVIDRLARGFVRAGHEVILAATGDSTCPVPTIAASPRSLGVGVACSEIHHVRRAYDGLRDCDVVHDHTLLGPQIAAATGDTRVVTTNHGEFAGVLLDLYSRIADRIPIIAISHAQAAAAPDLKIARVIHHGLDVDRYPAGLGDGGYFLFLGRMAPEKGAHRAARVARDGGGAAAHRGQDVRAGGTPLLRGGGRALPRPDTWSTSARSTSARSSRSLPVRGRSSTRSVGPSPSAWS